MQVTYHTENGALGFGRVVTEEDKAKYADIDLTNAGGQYVYPKPGMCFFNHADSFAMIRGGRVDIAVLGVLEVSEKGDLANWMFPGRGVGNIGGGMDLAFCAKRVIGATEHTTKDNKPKIVKTMQHSAHRSPLHGYDSNRYCGDKIYSQGTGLERSCPRLDGRRSSGID